MSTKNTTVEPFPWKGLAVLGLAGIILLGAFLRFYQLGAASIGNEYYAATVRSMLTSGHNFFFAAFEPGGSVSVDKPPLGFWLEALSAAVLGVNGFALAFPNALAGTLSIPLLYGMVQKQFGRLAGLSAALALAVTPITIAAERNNTIDGMLVFVLLLAAWATWKSVESGKVRYLLLGAGLVGLGFNIKMLQAYMILPALYALYFLGAKHSWRKRIAHLGLATGLLLVISLSWALVVDAVPADDRPYIGSSTDNTVMELVIGHNGIKRLLGGPGSQQPSASLALDAGDGRLSVGPGSGSLPPLGQRPPQGGPLLPLDQASLPGGPNEVGTPGILRLFTEPLASQASWLLPLALLGLALALVLLGRPWPPTPKHLALLLWAGWLGPVALYFSFTSGLWHTYYLIMAGPPVAALAGAAVWALGQIRSQGLRWSAAALLSGITLGFEIFILSAYPDSLAAASILAILLWLAGLALLWVRPHSWAPGILLLSLLVGPLLWSGLTTLNPQPDVNLPKAGPGTGSAVVDTSGAALSATQQSVLEYLLANTDPQDYLVATLDSHGASPFILASGRAVLTFGGFNGSDTVITAAQLQEMVASRKLRFVLDNGNLDEKPEISSWVLANCQVAEVPGVSQPVQAVNRPSSGGPRDQLFTALYDCGG